MSTSWNKIRVPESRNYLRNMRLRHSAAVNRAAPEMAYAPDSIHHRLRRSAVPVRKTQNPRPHNDLWTRASWFELRPDLGTAPRGGRNSIHVSLSGEPCSYRGYVDLLSLHSSPGMPLSPGNLNQTQLSRNAAIRLNSPATIRHCSIPAGLKTGRHLPAISASAGQG